MSNTTQMMIEVNEETQVDLAELIALETTAEGEPLNTTTIINRAVQVYAVLTRLRRDGERIYSAHEDLVVTPSRQLEFTAIDWT
jgi:hypothetical protein